MLFSDILRKGKTIYPIGKTGGLKCTPVFLFFMEKQN